MKLTKNNKSAVIIQALYVLDDLPIKTDKRVISKARLSNVVLDREYSMAVKVLEQRIV